MDLNDLLQEIENLNIENNTQAQSQLNEYIKKTYNLFCKTGSITDWQKIYIVQAIAAYKINWLFLCKFSLISAFEDDERISKEPGYVARCKETVEKLNMDELLSNI